MILNKKRRLAGFTIIELVVVIAIIAILFAIVTVSYNSIHKNAVVTGLQSDLNNASDLLRVDQTKSSTGSFPVTLDVSNGGDGVSSSPDTTFNYVVNNTNTPKTFCLTATKEGRSYHITQDGKLYPSVCPVLDFDVSSQTSYPGSGTYIYDLSGNGRKGTLSAGVSYSSANDGSLNFDGVGLDNVYVSGLPANVTTYFSSEVWVNSRNTSIDQTIFSRNGPFFMRISAGKLRVGIYTGSWLLTTGSKALSSNVWHHLVLTYDGSFVKSYVDGVLDLNVAKTGNFTTPSYATIGYPSTAGEQFVMNGLVGAARIYDVTLSESEVKENFNASHSRYGL